MSWALEVVSRIEELGGYLALDADGEIRYRVPKDSSEAQGLLAELRKHREWVMELLRQREANKSNWPPASLDAERRFGQPHASCFPSSGARCGRRTVLGRCYRYSQDRVTVAARFAA